MKRIIIAASIALAAATASADERAEFCGGMARLAESIGAAQHAGATPEQAISHHQDFDFAPTPHILPGLVDIAYSPMVSGMHPRMLAAMVFSGCMGEE